MVADLSLDQVSDVVNRQAVGYSQKQRNQMIRQGVQDPNAFALQNKDFLQQAEQPSSYRPAGQEIGTEQFSQNNNSNIESYLGKVSASNPTQQKWGIPIENDPDGGIRMGYTTIQHSIPTTLKDFYTRYGNAPTGGWNDYNTYQGGQDESLWGWMKDSSLLPNFSLYGTGSAEDVNRGYNVLQYLSPRNIGEFWSLKPDAQRGMLQNPGVALQQMQRYANPANGDWLSVGAEGGFSDMEAYNWDAQRGLTVDPSKYMQVHSDGGALGGLFGGVFDFMDPILDKVNPLHNTLQDLVTDAGGFDSQKEAFGTIAPIVLAVLSAGAASGAAGAGGAAGTSGGISAGAAGAGSAAGMGGALGTGITAGTAGAGLSAGAGLAGATAGGVLGTGLTTSQILTGINAINNLSKGDFLGAAMGGMNAAGISPTNSLSGLFSEAGVNPAVAQALGGVGVNTALNMSRGMDTDRALLSSIFGSASGYAGNELTKALSPSLGQQAGNILGGAASGGINSLFNKGDAVAGSLYGGMSGGLHGFLNSYGRGAEAPISKQENQQNKETAQNLTKLAKLFIRK